MLKEIGSKEKVPEYIKRVKAGEFRLMGFGHRVYKNYDPRARIIKRVASEVFEVTGKNPLLEIALELERIALEDDYFVSRKLYPNVDFYSGIIYQAMRFPGGDVSRVCLPFRALPAGSPSGRRCYLIRNRKSPAHARSMKATTSGISCRWRSGKTI